ncbi:MAG: hypothetical protein B6229_04210 [Spirochaetaceae bacterium 4572_7]|nr:MAG: hypothetical protein B6229_04210 [Spirochaetaceae bacterium 4572_7]
MSVKEIVFISGKGGTGKTTMTSSLIPHFKNIVVADCDVDAPDLDILLEPKIITTEDFVATSKAVIDPISCTNCGKCIDTCKFDAIVKGDKVPVVKEVYCEGCNACTLVCASDSIKLEPYKTGEIFLSETKYGGMAHGRLTPGEEVSGRLVSEVRSQAKTLAKKFGADTIIIDGPPGIACNVISAITGTALAVIVTEPTTSGYHDLLRVHDTTKKLSVKAAVIINKEGLSSEYSKKIQDYCEKEQIELLGKVSLSKEILKSVNRKEIPTFDGIEDIVRRIKENYV